jgi:hypothetical protein
MFRFMTGDCAAATPPDAVNIASVADRVLIDNMVGFLTSCPCQSRQATAAIEFQFHEITGP